jgi:hypothetical protein
MDRNKLKKAVEEFKIWCKKFRNRRIAWIMGHVKSKIEGIVNYLSGIQVSHLMEPALPYCTWKEAVDAWHLNWDISSENLLMSMND